METTIKFDLNQAIQRWRENLGQSPAFRSENLDELEAHLRDSIATLQTRGLSTEEAFLVAAHRLGQPAEIALEFGVVNPGLVWGARAFWMLAGMLFWLFGTGVISLVKSIAVYAGSWFTHNGLSLGWLSGVMHTLAFASIIVIFWLLANGRLAGSPEIGKQLQQRPGWWLGGFMVGLLLLQLSSSYTFVLTYKHLAPEVLGQRYMIERWFSIGIGLLQTAAIIGGILWLRRRQSKQVSIHS